MDRLKGMFLAVIFSLVSLMAVSAETVDINTATADQMATGLVGIGKAKATAIVQDREKNGPFKSVDDLTRVKGIKAATIAKNRDKITVGGGAAAAPAKPGSAAPPVKAAPAVTSAPAAAPPK